MPINCGGADGKCLYIDSRGTNLKKHLPPIAEHCSVPERDILNNVNYARAYHAEQQSGLLNLAPALMAESRYALVIVDSANQFYR